MRERFSQFIAITLVYKLKPGSVPCPDPQVQWSWADENNTRRLFANDGRQRIFLGFLERGFQGVFLSDDDIWIAHCWISTPSTLGPTHLARSIQTLNVYWLLYGRTREEYRGRGHLKETMSLLAYRARTQDPQADVFVDAMIHNIPARRAMLRVGFEPSGMTITLRFPKLDRKWGYWFRNWKHPRMPERRIP
jgi:RimJ/RimL family protein N-acetyltransferase